MNPDITASDLLGYAAALLVLVTFLAQSMTMLRSIAIASNVMFIAYALTASLTPVLLLHALLLPVNAWHLWQAARAQPAARRQAQEPRFIAPPLASFRSGLPPLVPMAAGPRAPASAFKSS